MSPLVKIAIVGAITAIAVDHFFKPTLRRTVGL
jgi:hypothetical protein